MKLKFINGKQNTKYTGNYITSPWKDVCYGYFQWDKFGINKNIEIVVVKQKSKLRTFCILIHELLHYINYKFFGWNKKINNLIQKYI